MIDVHLITACAAALNIASPAFGENFIATFVTVLGSKRLADREGFAPPTPRSSGLIERQNTASVIANFGVDCLAAPMEKPMTKGTE